MTLLQKRTLDTRKGDSWSIQGTRKAGREGGKSAETQNLTNESAIFEVHQNLALLGLAVFGLAAYLSSHFVIQPGWTTPPTIIID